MTRLIVEPHPLLAVAAFETKLDGALGARAASPGLVALLAIGASVPLLPDDGVRERVRAMLRHGGYKPSGRGKPASEYLARVAGEGPLRSINPAVDACNVVSLHSSFPISVVDLDRTHGDLAIRIGREGESYVFNASGQTIDVAGLVVLCDEDGPCANAVKDAQRTKTHEATTRTLSIVWGTRADRDRLDATVRWYAALAGEHLAADIITTLVQSSDGPGSQTS